MPRNTSPEVVRRMGAPGVCLPRRNRALVCPIVCGRTLCEPRRPAEQHEGELCRTGRRRARCRGPPLGHSRSRGGCAGCGRAGPVRQQLRFRRHPGRQHPYRRRGTRHEPCGGVLPVRVEPLVASELLHLVQGADDQERRRSARAPACHHGCPGRGVVTADRRFGSPTWNFPILLRARTVSDSHATCGRGLHPAPPRLGPAGSRDLLPAPSEFGRADRQFISHL